MGTPNSKKNGQTIGARCQEPLRVTDTPARLKLQSLYTAVVSSHSHEGYVASMVTEQGQIGTDACKTACCTVVHSSCTNVHTTHRLFTSGSPARTTDNVVVLYYMHVFDRHIFLRLFLGMV